MMYRNEWKKEVLAYVKVLLQNLLGGTEENYEKSQSVHQSLG